MEKSFKSPVVILANGSFPTHPIPLKFLTDAGTVICTDGSANTLDKLNLIPHVIIGDLDSIDPNNKFHGLEIHDQNQENTDLEKGLADLLRLNDGVPDDKETALV